MLSVDLSQELAKAERDLHAGVSVILPTFDRAEYIGTAIRSILQQSVPLRDIVIVDDGSRDSTAEVVAEFGDQVTYIRQENAGKLVAIARGLDHVGGEFVWIMDDDDIADPRAVEVLLRPLADDPACVLSYGRMSKFSDGDADPQTDVQVAYPEQDDRPFLPQLMEDCFVTGHPCVLVRRSALDSMRPFRSDILASVDYYLHLGVARLGTTAFVDHRVLRQRQHSGSRGPEALRYAEDDRNARWAAHDQLLIAPMLEDLPLGAYVYGIDDPRHADDTVADPIDRRRALLQKGVIAARKKLWPAAFEAFRDGAEILPDVSITPDERQILSRALGCRYGIPEVYEDPGIPARLRRIATRRADVQAFLVALSRPLLHEVKIAWRERDLARVRNAAAAWRSLMTWQANLSAVTEILRRNGRRAIGR